MYLIQYNVTNLYIESVNINVYFSSCNFCLSLIKHNRTSRFKSMKYSAFHVVALLNIFFISARPYSKGSTLLLGSHHVDCQPVQIRKQNVNILINSVNIYHLKHHFLPRMSILNTLFEYFLFG